MPHTIIEADADLLTVKVAALGTFPLRMAEIVRTMDGKETIARLCR
jgi:hypothetical protein